MNEFNKEEFGKRLKKIIDSKNITAYDISQKLGFSVNTFYHYIAGRRMMSIDTALGFAKLMNISLDYLFYEDSDDDVLYEWLYKTEPENLWNIHTILMTEPMAKVFFERNMGAKEYKKSGREFLI